MTEDALIEMEHGFWDAAGDGSFYAEHMHDDGRCLLPVGAMGKAATIEAIDRAEPWATHDFSDVELHEPADGVAVLTYRARGTRDSSDEPYEALIATTYVREGGTWKLLVHQQTPLMAQHG